MRTIIFADSLMNKSRFSSTFKAAIDKYESKQTKRYKSVQSESLGSQNSSETPIQISPQNQQT